jgi:hypothetical protein
MMLACAGFFRALQINIDFCKMGSFTHRFTQTILEGSFHFLLPVEKERVARPAPLTGPCVRGRQVWFGGGGGGLPGPDQTNEGLQ